MFMNYRGRYYNEPINYYPAMYGGYFPYRYDHPSGNNQQVMPEANSCGKSGTTLSALNQLPGVITSVQVTGVVGEVQINLGCNHLASAIITATSIRNLNLRPGSRVNVVFIATSVMIRKSSADAPFSARNRFNGTVTQLDEGDIVGKVVVDIGCGHIISAIIPEIAIKDLCIEVGSKVSTDIKATEIMIMDTAN